MANNITVFEVPSEAGTHWAGQHQAPEYLKRAGLQNNLTAEEYSVTIEQVLDDGPAYWTPTPLRNGVRNEENAVAVIKQLDEALKRRLSPDVFPIVIGGDCSLLVACMSAFSHVYPSSSCGLLYVDNDADLTLPEETSAAGSTGILDSMTMSNLTQRPGCLESVKQFSSTENSPTVSSDNTVLFGLDLTQPKVGHFACLLDHHYQCFSSLAVQNNPTESAKYALSWLEERRDKIWLHLDIDVVDSAQYPMGNFPSYGGIGFDEVMAAVSCFLRSENPVGMSLTEVNPNNDPSGEMMHRLVDALAKAFSERSKGFAA